MVKNQELQLIEKLNDLHLKHKFIIWGIGVITTLLSVISNIIATEVNEDGE